MDFTIDGTVAQSARLVLAEGETMWASKGSIVAYATGLKWDVKVPGLVAGGGQSMRGRAGGGRPLLLAITHEPRGHFGGHPHPENR